MAKQDVTYARTASDIERKYNFGKSFSEAMNLAEQAKRQADEAYSVATNIKGIFFFIRYSAYSDGTNMTEEPQADTVYMGTCSTNVDEAPTDNAAYTWTKILGNDGAKGEDGETGVGVSEMKAQFYLSTSKTTQTGGSWVDSMPTWSNGKYLWIRHVVTYTDGNTAYTSPQCDSSWEAVTELDTKLNHEEIFNRLSQGNQGVYRDSTTGNYYINASYIKSGEFLADLIKAGVIKSKDGESVVIDLDNGDVKLTGTIQTKVTADEDEYGLSRQATFRPDLISMSEKRENDDGSSNRCQTWIMPGSVYMYDSYYDANGSLTKRETIGFDLYNKCLRGLADPNINSDGSDAVNKRYVDKKFLPISMTNGEALGVNLNTTFDPGFYGVGGGSTGLPEGSYGNMLVLPYRLTGGIYPVQLFFAHNSYDDMGMWYRVYQGSTSTWKTWHKVSTIVAQDTSNGWTYVKYGDGTAMCWKATTNVSSSFSSTWGNLYVHDYLIAQQTYPFPFVDYPKVFVMPRPLDGNTTTTGDYWLYTGKTGTNTISPSFGVARPTKPSAAITLCVNMLVIGRWK